MTIKRPVRTDRLLIKRRMLWNITVLVGSCSWFTRLAKPVHLKLAPLSVLVIQTGLRFDIDFFLRQLMHFFLL